MKKRLILFIGALLILCLISFLILAQAKKRAPVEPTALKPSIAQPKEPLSLHEEGAAPRLAEVHPQAEQVKEEYFNRFMLPQKLRIALSEARKNGNIKVEWGEGKISKKELEEAGLFSPQLAQTGLDSKINNIAAGYSVSDKTFAENLNNCLPVKATEDKQANPSNSEAPSSADSSTPEKPLEDEQTRILNSDALSDMGFSALMEYNYTQAEEAFTAIIRDYADTQAAPIVHLELARLISDEGRAKEALALIDKAITQYNNDKEYVAIAESLKKAIEANE